MDEVSTAYYLRIHVQDRPGVLADVTQIFAEHAISIEAIIQKEPQTNITSVPIVILTHKVIEQNMNQAILEVEKLEAVTHKIMRIRLENFILIFKYL